MQLRRLLVDLRPHSVTSRAAGVAPRTTRAVHHYERAAMTSVFMTFRQVGSLVVPGALAIVLWVLPLWAVFAVGGLMTLAMAGLSRYLPQRL